MKQYIKNIIYLIVSLFLISYTIYPLNAQNTTPRTTKNKKNEGKTISLIKFIPGLQQIKQKKYFKGSLLFGSFLATTSGAFIFNNNGNNWYDKYKNSTNVSDIVYFRDRAEKNFRNRNLAIIGIFSVWLVHIIDLKFFKPKKKSNRTISAGLTANVGFNHARINFYYVF